MTPKINHILIMHYERSVFCPVEDADIISATETSKAFPFYIVLCFRQSGEDVGGGNRLLPVAYRRVISRRNSSVRDALKEYAVTTGVP